MHALISIHDVMPSTLTQVAGIIAKLDPIHAPNTTLLVVPGLNWKAEDIAQLRHWQKQGFELVGHGWVHHAPVIRTFYHRLHSLFISRNAAEHLSYSTTEVRELIERNYHWFTENDLGKPTLYVPPAWALGKLSKSELKELPFRYYEDSSGIYDTLTATHKRLPLLGFEADTPLRKYFLMLWNKINRGLSSAKRPVRVSLHPFDLEYLLGKDIPLTFAAIQRSWHHKELF